MQQPKTVENYGKDRIEKLGLSEQDFFTYDRLGNVLINYHTLQGEPLRYSKQDDRKTAAAHGIPERYFLAPYVVTRWKPEVEKFCGHKYNSPKGVSVAPFFPREVIQAYQTQKQLQTLVFTEGEIKSAVACKQGIYTVSFRGVANYKLCKEIRSLLSTCKPQNIVINYDSDAIGHKNIGQFYSSAFWFCREIFSMYETQGEPLPCLKICIPTKDFGKGIDDILQERPTAAQDFKTLSTSKFFLFTEIAHQAVNFSLEEAFSYKSYKYTDYENCELVRAKWSDQGERLYLSDALENYEGEFFGKLWVVPTGYGKTNFVLKQAATNFVLKQAATGQKIVFFLPKIDLVEQVFSDAKDMGIDVVQFNGDKPTRQILAQKIAKRIFTTGEPLPTLIVCTYASAAKLCQFMGEATDDYHSVVDEWHNTTAAAHPNFMNMDLNRLIELFQRFKSITGLTATPLTTLDPRLNLKTVFVKVSGIPKTKYYQLTCENVLASARDAIKNSLKKGRVPFVYLNSKGAKLKELLKLCEQHQVQVEAINADTKETDHHKKIIEGETLSDIATIGTSVAKEGMNVTDKTPIDVILIGKHHPAEIRQICSRFRCADVILTILVPTPKGEKKQVFRPSKTDMGDKVKAAQKFCDVLNTLGDDTDPNTEAIRRAIQNPYFYKDSSGTFHVNFLAIQNEYFFAEIGYYNSSKEILSNALRSYDFEPINQRHNILGDSRTEAEKIEIEQLKAETKAQAASDIAEALSELATAKNPRKHAEQGKANNTTTKAKKFVFEAFLELRELCKTNEQAREILLATKGDKSAIRRAVLRLKSILSEKDKTPIGKAADAIRDTFAGGTRLTPQQVKEAFLAAIRTDDTMRTKDFEKIDFENQKRMHKILKVLRIFFEVEKSGKGGRDYEFKELPKVFRGK
jgi:hypothetical protein